MTLNHTQSKNRNKIKREVGRSIFNGFNRLNPAKRNLESDPSYHLWKKVPKNIANGSLRHVFILMDVHTQKPKIQTERAWQSRFGREKSHQKVPTSTKREG